MHHLLLVASLLLVGGCAESSPSSDAPQTAVVEDGSVEITGNDRLEFLPDDVTATSGDLTIQLTCAGAVPHNLLIEETDTAVAECGGEGELSLEPGTYTFYCSIRGHRQAGMEGTLTIEG
ncbi:MAG: hypothetical protein R3343_11750 [Nitriliruptorales bacterium]|nr:hypothetical protein [Nitriliruptorales bacterium]